MKKLNAMYLLMAIALCTLMLFPSSVAAEKKFTIAFSQSTMNHPWRVSLTNDMIYWAEKMGVNLIWNEGQNDAARQLTCVEDLIAKKPDALIMTPLQSKALTPVKELCEKAKIPLIVVDREIVAEPGQGMYVSFIGEDQVEEGRQAARLLVKKLTEKYGKPKGNVVEIQGTIGASPTIDRKKGFEEVINQYPDIKLVATQSGDFLRGNAMSIMENYLQRFPKGQVDAVFTHNDEMGLGALQAIKAAGRTELVGWICSIDGQRDALKAVLDGEFLIVVQNPPYFGELGIKTALAYLKGEKVPARQWLQFKAFSADTPENRKATQEYYNYLVANDLMY